MRQVRRIVRGLKWSIRLERLEDRLPLDGGLGAIVQEQLQSIYFNYAQIQTISLSNSSSTEVNSGLSGDFDLLFYAMDTPSAYQLSEGSSTAYNRYDGNRWVESRGITAADKLSIVDVDSDRGRVPVPNPIMIPLPTPPDLVAIANPIEGRIATPVSDISKIVKEQDAKAPKAIDRTIRIGESNQLSNTLIQRNLENIAMNATFPDHSVRERSTSSPGASIKQPVENVRAVSSEPFAQSTEIRTNRISRDMYYGKTNVANARQELAWSTDVLASATRQQVISESSALLAIIASNVTNSSMSKDDPNKDTEPDLVEQMVRLVSHVSQFEPSIEVLETNPPVVTDDSKRQSMGSVESRTNQNANEGTSLLYSSWGTYVLALAGMTLSLASSETREFPTEPELLTAKTNRLFPFGKGSV